MFGAVLWSDNKNARAVIWCEDQGALAFFNGKESAYPGIPDLEPGDLVQFDITETRQMRHAHNPRVVSENEYPTLGRQLQAATCPPVNHGNCDMSGHTAEIGAQILGFEEMKFGRLARESAQSNERPRSAK